MNYRMIFHMLSRVAIIQAALMCLPLIVSFIYGENELLAFLIPIAAAAAVGIALWQRKNTRTEMYAREGFLTVALSWIMMSLIGALPYLISGEIPNVADAIFESVSGFTTTGATILSDIEALPKSLLFWRNFTHWIGGMGVLVFMMALLPQSKAHSLHIMRAEVPSPTVGKLVSKINLTARILYVIYVFLTVAETAVLMLCGLDVYDSIMCAFSTAGTGGFLHYNASVAHFGSVSVEIVLTIFMFLFGVNFSIYFLIITRRIKAAVKNEELRWYSAFVIGAVALIAITLVAAGMSGGESIRNSVFTVVSIITTTGFVISEFNVWPTFAKMIIILLMFSGACSGSTGGGMKVSRVAVLFKSAWYEIKKAISPRSVDSIKMDKTEVPLQVVRGVNAYFIIEILLIAASTLVLSIFAFDLETNFTVSLSCLSNVGPVFGSIGATGNLGGYNEFSKVILIFNMLAGRLGLYPMLLLFLPKSWKR